MGLAEIPLHLPPIMIYGSEIDFEHHVLRERLIA
jgi:hypothetical protein